VASFFQVAFPMIAAERQGSRMRRAYLEAVLRQEMGWHDQSHTAEVATRMSEDVLGVLNGIGDKMTNLIQHSTTAILSIILGFYRGPALAGVVLSFVPLMAFAMGAVIPAMSSGQATESAGYARAGELATEAISSIRTVASNCGEAAEIERYASQLKSAERAGVKKAFAMGTGFGGMWFFMMAAYAVGLWYGGTQVLASRQSNPTCRINPVADGCYSGGAVINTFFAIIIGESSSACGWKFARAVDVLL
jgi:ABC-type multidrug transport system fused ATPase/permease subunit